MILFHCEEAAENLVWKKPWKKELKLYKEIEHDI